VALDAFSGLPKMTRLDLRNNPLTNVKATDLLPVAENPDLDLRLPGSFTLRRLAALEARCPSAGQRRSMCGSIVSAPSSSGSSGPAGGTTDVETSSGSGVHSDPGNATNVATGDSAEVSSNADGESSGSDGQNAPGASGETTGNSTAPVTQVTTTTSGGDTSTGGTSTVGSSPSPPPSASVTVFVIKMAVWMPMTKESFMSDGKTKFKISMANAAGVAVTDIVIVKIENINRARRRRLLVRCVCTPVRLVKVWCWRVCGDISTCLQAEGVRVDFTVKTTVRADADKIKDTMTEGRINAELAKSGLPNAAIVEAPTVEQVDSATSMSSDTGDEVDHEASVCLLIHSYIEDCNVITLDL